MSTYQDPLNNHENCIACSDGKQNPQSMQLKFTYLSETEVTANYRVNRTHQGYTNLLHGGIASTLLDAAMTQCLLLNGINALTTELSVRFYTPIHVGDTITITGCLLNKRHSVYMLNASLRIVESVAAKATGKFIVPKKGVIIHQ